MEIIQSIIKKYSTLPTIEMKLFWACAPMIALFGFCCGLITIFETHNIIAVCGAFSSFVIPVIIIIICVKTNKYNECFNALAFTLSCLIVPFTFFANGGMISGMPIICVISVVVPCLCSDRKERRVLVILAIVVQTACIVLETRYPELVTKLSGGETAVEYDILTCYVLGSIGLSILLDILLDEYKAYSKSKEVLNRYMDVGLQNQILENPEELIDAPGHKAKVTVLFADISSFTSITEGMTPEESAEFINLFLSVADEDIHDNLGVIDKYIGDCVMAYWIDTGQDGGGVFEACRAVNKMREDLHNKAEEVFKRFGCELDFSAGINYGEVVIGGIGSSNRKDFTIIGDAVNTCQRLQSMATRGTTYISKEVRDILGEEANVEVVSEKMTLKGKAVPLEVYSFKSLKTNHPDEQVSYEVRSKWKSTATGYMFHICGCRGSYAVSGDIYSEFGGETSCYIIKKDKYAMVIDCGTGFYKARDILSDCENIDVLLTHVHYDHLLGLLDWSIFPKNAKLRFFGDFANWEGKETINNLLRGPYWPVNNSNGEIISVEKKKLYQLTSETDVTFYDSYHPNNCSIMIIHAAGRKICIMADCEDHNVIPDAVVANSDILLFDAMYEDKDFPDRAGWGHSTWEEAVRYANVVKPAILLVTHHDPRNSDRTLRAHEGLAKLKYNSTIFARQGSKISL